MDEIAAVLDFSTTHPFHNGLFGPVISWIEKDRDLLQRLRAGDVQRRDLERAWEILTADFTAYRKGIRAAYLKMVRETYLKAGLAIPAT